MSRNNYNRSGFTLIEVIVVLGIMVALAGVAMFSLKSSGKDRQMEAAVFSIKAELDMARTHAMANGTAVRVGFSLEPQLLTVLSMEYRLGGIPPSTERSFQSGSSNWSRLSKNKSWTSLTLATGKEGESGSTPLTLFNFTDRVGGKEQDYSYVLEFRPSGEVVAKEGVSEKRIVLGLTKTQGPKQIKWISISSVTGLVAITDSEEEANEN